MIKTANNFIKKIKTYNTLSPTTIILVSIFISFFTCAIIITFDGAHYLSYLPILERTESFAMWEAVRGPVFPLIIFLSNLLFGKTSQGILICLFIFYVLFVKVCDVMCTFLCCDIKRYRKTIQCTLLLLLVFNPIIFGYFHVLLTEFIAITMTMLNILVAFKWVKTEQQSIRKQVYFYIYFALSLVFCYHLKQPYFTIALVPNVVAAVMSIINNHRRSNVLYRLGVVAVSVACLFLSILAWNHIINITHVDSDSKNGGASSMASSQLLEGAGIHEQHPSSFSDALNIYFGYFFEHPLSVMGKYITNYCSLTSLCKINTPNGVYYESTSQINLLDSYENSAIGYRTFSSYDNIFSLTNELSIQAEYYKTTTDTNILDVVMMILSKPTNIIYKITLLLCPIAFIISIVFTTKAKKKKLKQQYNIGMLSVLLTGTAFLHVSISAVMGLVIDRYSVEAFIPACLGIFSTIRIWFMYKKQLTINLNYYNTDKFF